MTPDAADRLAATRVTGSTSTRGAGAAEHGSGAPSPDAYQRRPRLTFGDPRRVLAITATGIFLALASGLAGAVYQGALMRGELGFDANLYARIGSHFLETGEAYFPVQSSPYEAAGTVNLYPPTALYLFVPASFAPRILWWVVPLAVIGVCLYRLRPAWWAWPLMAFACIWPIHAPDIPVGLVYGNTLMWTLAAMLAAATFRPGIAWAVLLKPTHFLFALPWAIRSWRGLAVMVGLSVVMLPLWFDWLEAMANLQNGGWLLLSPALAIPLIAWVSRRRLVSEPSVPTGDPTASTVMTTW